MNFKMRAQHKVFTQHRLPLQMPHLLPWLPWLLALLLGLPLAAWLPASAGWEGNWMESAQVLVLLAGAALAGRPGWPAIGRRAQPSQIGGSVGDRQLALSLVPIWLLLALRELSWGATLLAPQSFSPVTGPQFTSSVLPYKPLVAPIAAAFLALALWSVWRQRLLPRMMSAWRQGRLGGCEPTVLVIGMLLSALAEGHLSLQLPAGLPLDPMVLEEWTELVAYAALVAWQWRVFAALRMH